MGEGIFADRKGFLAALVRENRLEEPGIARFLFFEGMLFGTSAKWWGKPGKRHAPHEGIDLCFFEAGSGRHCRLDAGTGVPMAADSRIVHIMDDFLGQTVVASRAASEAGGREELTLYAHIRPETGLRVGDRVARGRIFSRIADVNYPATPMPPHLHISMAWADQLPEYRQWTWKLLNQCGCASFINPLEHLDLPARVVTQAPGRDPAAGYSPCGGV